MPRFSIFRRDTSKPTYKKVLTFQYFGGILYT